ERCPCLTGTDEAKAFNRQFTGVDEEVLAVSRIRHEQCRRGPGAGPTRAPPIEFISEQVEKLRTIVGGLLVRSDEVIRELAKIGAGRKGVLVGRQRRQVADAVLAGSRVI